MHDPLHSTKSFWHNSQENRPKFEKDWLKRVFRFVWRRSTWRQQSCCDTLVLSCVSWPLMITPFIFTRNTFSKQTTIKLATFYFWEETSVRQRSRLKSTSAQNTNLFTQFTQLKIGFKPNFQTTNYALHWKTQFLSISIQLALKSTQRRWSPYKILHTSKQSRFNFPELMRLREEVWRNNELHSWDNIYPQSTLTWPWSHRPLFDQSISPIILSTLRHHTKCFIQDCKVEKDLSTKSCQNLIKPKSKKTSAFLSV